MSKIITPEPKTDFEEDLQEEEQMQKRLLKSLGVEE